MTVLKSMIKFEINVGSKQSLDFMSALTKHGRLRHLAPTKSIAILLEVKIRQLRNWGLFVFVAYCCFLATITLTQRPEALLFWTLYDTVFYSN